MTANPKVRTEEDDPVEFKLSDDLTVMVYLQGDELIVMGSGRAMSGGIVMSPRANNSVAIRSGRR